MADVINFKCSGCDKAYSVAPSYIGRQFTCKACGTALTVPGQSKVGGEVHMDSGAQVMRRTTSGRQVVADPTRVFKKHRETSGRVPAVAPVTAEKPKSKLPVFVVAGAVAVLLAGLGIAAALGVFSSDETNANDVADRPASNSDPAAQTQASDRAGIFTELEGLDGEPAGFRDLYVRAADAGLNETDLKVIGGRAAKAIRGRAGGDMSDDDLLAFAAELQKINAAVDARMVYDVVVSRGRGKLPPDEAFLKARAALGHHRIELPAAIQRADELAAYGIVDEVSDLAAELKQIRTRTDQGWVDAADKGRFDEIIAALDDAQDEVDRVRREDPFLFTTAVAEARFRAEPVASRGNWETFRREPFVMFCQQKVGETRDKTEMRMQTALDAMDQFGAFFRETFAGPMGLKRSLPSELLEGERAAAPIEIVILGNPSQWKAYLRDQGVTGVKETAASSFTEWASGRVSLVYDEEEEHLGKFVQSLVAAMMYNHHPDAPTTKEEDEAFSTFKAYCLSAYYTTIFASGRLNRDTNTFEFFAHDTTTQTRLQGWNRPFDSVGTRVSAFGGPAFTIRNLVSITSLDDAKTPMRENFKAYGNWEPNLLGVITSDTNTRGILSRYLRGFFNFLYYWTDDGENYKYRDGFLKFMKSDMDGHVDAENPLPGFETAMGLDEAGWQQIEQDWLDYQTP